MKPHKKAVFLRRGSSPALTIPLLYLAFGALWISCSDFVVGSIVTSAAHFQFFSVIKGWLFVFVTGALLFALLKRYTGKVEVHQQQLAVSEQHLKEAQQTARIGSWELGPDGEFTWSESIAELFGFDPETAPAIDRLIEAAHPEDRAALRAAFSAAPAPGDVVFRITRADNGERRRMHARSTRQRDPAGKIIQSAGTVQDVTVRLENEERVRSSEALTRSLMDNLPDLVWLKDPDGVYLDCNPRFESLCGAGVEEIRGKTDYDFTERAAAARYRDDDLKAAESRKPIFLEEWVTYASSGQRALLETIKTPLYDEAGRLTGVLGVGRDITVRRQLEQRFRMLFERTPSGVAIYEPLADNTDFVLVDMNPAGLQYSGISRDEVIGRRVTEAFPGIEKSGLLAVFRRVAQTGRAERSPLLLYEDERTQQWVENVVYKLPCGLVVAVYSDQTEKRTAEARLRASEENYRSVVEDSPVMICSYAFDGTIQFINQACCRCFQRPAEELLGTSFTELIPPENRAAVLETIHSLTREHPVVSHEHPVCAPNGETVWHRWTNRALFDEEGRIVSFQAFGEDITAQIQAQADLEQQRKLMSDVVDAIPDLLWLKDPAGAYLLCNREFERMVDFTRDQIIGLTDGDLFPPQWAASNRAYDLNVIKAGEPQAHEESVRYPDGAAAWIETVKTPVFSAQHDLIGVLGIGRDISARREALQESRRRQDFLDQVVDQSPIPMYITSPDGTALRGNRALAKMMNSTEDQVLSELSPAGRGSQTAPEIARKIEQAYTRRQGVRYEVQWDPAQADGMERGDPPGKWIDVSVFPLFNSDDEITHFVVQLIDISDRKRAEEERARHQLELEKQVHERTKELRMIVNSMAGRENRMADLKLVIRALRAQLEAAGLEPAAGDPLAAGRLPERAAGGDA